MKTTANQRIITINKGVCDTNNLFTSINLEVLEKAMYHLKTEGGIKLFIYLAKNQPNYQLALSSKHFCDWANVCLGTYNKGIDELIKNGYLQLVKTDNKKKLYYYNFYETQYTNVSIVPKPIIVQQPRYIH